MSEFTETTGELARKAEVATPTVRKYADAGLLEFVVISNGVRLFRTGQTDKVREIYKKHLGNRGRKTA